MIPLKRLRLNPSSKTSWFKIPYKIRAIIIDEMDAKTRCIFSKCSKLCNEEAKKSKFYIYGLSIFDDGDGSPYLKFMYDEFDNGYCLKFLWAKTSQTIVVYSCLKVEKETVIWTTLENGKTEDVRLRYLRYYLEIYKKQLQFFEFSCSTSFDFTLRHLENLKKIQIIETPGEWTSLKDIPFIDEDQLLNMDTIDLPEMEITSKHLFDFKGKNASVSIEDFDEDNCKKYLKMLKSGEITVNNVEIGARILRNMDFSKIGDDFEVSNYTVNEDHEISFNFYSDDRKYSVCFDGYELKIKTIEVFKKMDKCIFWQKLPLHIQEVVIYQMDPKSRCRFAQCSKNSEKEAKRSKNYLYKIGVFENPGWYLELQFAFSENSEKDFWFEFMDDYAEEDRTIVLYKTWKNGEEFMKWTKVENGKPKEVRLKYLKEYLSKYEKVIKYFYFDDDTILLREFNINNLRNFERVYIRDNTEQFPDYLKLGYLDWESIRRCKHVFLHNDAVLSFEQLLELDIETAEIQCYELEKMNNFKNYLNMLKNGTVHKNLKEIRFNLTNEEKMNIQGLGPFLKIEESPITLKYSVQSNVIENQIIEVFQKFGDYQYHISIKCYEHSEV